MEEMAERENREVPGALHKPLRALQPSNRTTATAPQKAGSVLPRGCSSGPSDSVKVVVRLRPQPAESSACLLVKSKEVVLVPRATIRSGLEASLGFDEKRYDYVANEATSQEGIFQVAGKPLVENVLAGYNAAILAYGQTGSGKTYTMTGDGSNEGIVQACFRELFHSLDALAKKGQLSFAVNVSYLEVWRENVYDLLRRGPEEKLKIEDDEDWGTRVKDLTEVEVDSVEGVLKVLQQGLKRRRQAATQKNERSSRSHAVLTCSLVVDATGASGARSRRFSRLHLVDLAGSERQKETGATAECQEDAKMINLSLTSLHTCIDGAIKKQKAVMFRNSKLTRLLQHALSGNAKLVLLATVSPSTADLEMSRSTLHFAGEIKKLPVKAAVNCKVSGNEATLAKQVQQLTADLEQLKQAAAARQQQEKELARLQEQLDAKDMALQKEKSRRADLEQQLAGLHASTMAADSSGAQLEVDTVIQQEMAALREEVQSLEAQADSLRADLTDAQNEKLDLQEQLHTWRRTAADWETAAKGLEGQLGEAQQAQNSSSDALAAALVRSAELEGQLQEARQARNSAAEALAAALARSQELEAKLGSLQRARGQELQAQHRLDEECTGPAAGQAGAPGIAAEDAASYAVIEAGSPAEEQRQAAAGAPALRQGGQQEDEEGAGLGGTPEPGSLLQRLFQRAGLCSSGPLAGQPALLSAASGSNPTVAGLGLQQQPAQQQQTSPFQGPEWQEGLKQLESEREEQAPQQWEGPGEVEEAGEAALQEQQQAQQRQQQQAGSQGSDSKLEQAVGSSGHPSPVLAGCPGGADSPVQLDCALPVEQQEANVTAAAAAAADVALAAAVPPKPPQQRQQGAGNGKKSSKRAASGAKRESACDRASRKSAAALALSARSFRQRAAGLGAAAAAPLAQAAAAAPAAPRETVDLTADSDSDGGSGGSDQQGGGTTAAWSDQGAGSGAVQGDREPQAAPVSLVPASGKRLRDSESAMQVAVAGEAASPGEAAPLANEGRKKRKLLPVRSSSRLSSRQ